MASTADPFFVGVVVVVEMDGSEGVSSVKVAGHSDATQTEPVFGLLPVHGGEVIVLRIVRVKDLVVHGNGDLNPDV